MTLKRVVFPAPFGPIMARFSPASTDSLHMVRTCRPPKRTSTSSISSAIIEIPWLVSFPRSGAHARPSEGLRYAIPNLAGIAPQLAYLAHLPFMPA